MKTKFLSAFLMVGAFLVNASTVKATEVPEGFETSENRMASYKRHDSLWGDKDEKIQRGAWTGHEGNMYKGMLAEGFEADVKDVTYTNPKTRYALAKAMLTPILDSQVDVAKAAWNVFEQLIFNGIANSTTTKAETAEETPTEIGSKVFSFAYVFGDENLTRVATLVWEKHVYNQFFNHEGDKKREGVRRLYHDAKLLHDLSSWLNVFDDDNALNAVAGEFNRMLKSEAGFRIEEFINGSLKTNREVTANAEDKVEKVVAKAVADISAGAKNIGKKVKKYF